MLSSRVHNNKMNVKSRPYSLFRRILSYVNSSAILALLLIDTPSMVMNVPGVSLLANAEKIKETDDGYALLPQHTGMLLIEESMAADNVQAFKRSQSWRDSSSTWEQPIFSRDFLDNQIKITFDYLGAACMMGKRNIANWLFKNHYYNPSILPMTIALSVWHQNNTFLKRLNFSKEQYSEAFKWLNDVIDENHLLLSADEKPLVSTLKSLVIRGADIEVAERNIFSIPLRLGHMGLLKLYLTSGADMYKQTPCDEVMCVPLNGHTLNGDFYSDAIIAFCQQGYDINFKEPRQDRDLVGLLISRFVPEHLAFLINKLNQEPATKVLAAGLAKRQKDVAFRHNTHFVLSSVASFIVFSFITKGYLQFKALRAAKLRAQKIKNIQEKQLTQRDVSLHQEKLTKKTTFKIMPLMPEAQITQTIVNDVPCVKPRKNSATSLFSHKQNNVIAIAAMKDAQQLIKRKSSEEKKIQGLRAKKQAVIHKVLWKKEKEAIKQESLKQESIVSVEPLENDRSRSSSSASVNTASLFFSSHKSFTSQACIQQMLHSATRLISFLSEQDRLPVGVVHLALLYNIHRYNLGYYSFMKKDFYLRSTNAFQVAREFRTLLMHSNCVQASRQAVFETADSLRNIIPYELSQLTKSHSQEKAIPDTDIQQLLALSHLTEVPSPLLDSIDDSPLYKSLALTANHQVSTSVFGEKISAQEEDARYYHWVLHIVFPTIISLFAKIISSDASSSIDTQIACDAIKMLMIACVEQYSIDRKKRIHEAKSHHILQPLLACLRELRGKMAHEVEEIKDEVLFVACSKIQKLTKVQCDLNHIDLAIPNQWDQKTHRDLSSVCRMHR